MSMCEMPMGEDDQGNENFCALPRPCPRSRAHVAFDAALDAYRKSKETP